METDAALLSKEVKYLGHILLRDRVKVWPIDYSTQGQVAYKTLAKAESWKQEAK